MRIKHYIYLKICWKPQNTIKLDFVFWPLLLKYISVVEMGGYQGAVLSGRLMPLPSVSEENATLLQKGRQAHLAHSLLVVFRCKSRGRGKTMYADAGRLESRKPQPLRPRAALRLPGAPFLLPPPGDGKAWGLESSNPERDSAGDQELSSPWQN